MTQLAALRLDHDVADVPNVSNHDMIRFSSLTNTHLGLIILPTEQCNFRCTYCYEDFEIGRMKGETIDGIIALMERRAPGLRTLHISYFGGEPMLNMAAIRKISAAALAVSERHGIKLTCDITTNGYLLDSEKLRELVELGCTTYQISLDGWRDGHDQTRVQRNKSGSFDRIWDNLSSAARSDLEFTILLRVHLHPDNRDSVVTLVENINETMSDHRFEVMFKKVGNWGGTNANHPKTYRTGDDFAAYHEKLTAMTKRVSSCGVEEAGGSQATKPAAAGTAGSPFIALNDVCYASKGNSLVIRANGRVNKCTVALSNPKNDIGSINADGSLTIDSNKLTPWLGGLGTMEHGYLACPASKILR